MRRARDFTEIRSENVGIIGERRPAQVGLMRYEFGGGLIMLLGLMRYEHITFSVVK